MVPSTLPREGRIPGPTKILGRAKERKTNLFTTGFKGSLGGAFFKEVLGI